jgi:hypothetical protein
MLKCKLGWFFFFFLVGRRGTYKQNVNSTLCLPSFQRRKVRPGLAGLWVPRLEFVHGRSLSWHVLYVYRTRETGNIYVTFVAAAWWRDDLISLIFPTELGGSCWARKAPAESNTLSGAPFFSQFLLSPDPPLPPALPLLLGHHQRTKFQTWSCLLTV